MPESDLNILKKKKIIFQRKKDLIFHVNHLSSLNFNENKYFKGLSTTNLPGTLKVKVFR